MCLAICLILGHPVFSVNHKANSKESELIHFGPIIARVNLTGQPSVMTVVGTKSGHKIRFYCSQLVL